MMDRGMRIMFLTHYFPPEIGAPQARMFELAKRLDEIGDEVTVVTAFPNYPTGVIHEGYRDRFAMEERMDGVRVVRRWVFATPNSGFFKRILNWLSFVVTSLTTLRSGQTRSAPGRSLLTCSSGTVARRSPRGGSTSSA